MRTTKGIPWRVSLSGAIAGALLVLLATGAQAATGVCADVDSCKIGSDRAASIVLYPKIVVDTSNGVDTVIQLVNSGERRTVGAHCFYVDTSSHCSNSGDFCRSASDCTAGETCNQNWQQIDFTLRLTKRQPLSWNASQRTAFLPCDKANPETPTSCIKDSEGQLIFNEGSIPPVQSDPFIGELKCVQIDDETEEPVDFNELTGNAVFIRGRSRLDSDVTGVDAAKYNAIGIQAIPNRNDGNTTLCLGGDDATADCPNGAEYASCPSVLIMNHFFDEARPEGEGTVRSSLTLVPCGEDLANGSIVNGVGNLPLTTVQFLVYNEFEQRFSTSFRFRCFDDRDISDIDTRFGDADDGASIFNIGVQGTIAGQTRIRSVGTSTEARGILGVLTESFECATGPGHECWTTSNLHFQGKRSLPDLIVYP